MSDKSQIKMDNLSFIKIFLMLCVVSGHAVNFWNRRWFTPFDPAYDSAVLVYFSDFLNSFHTYAFTLVSGYLFYYLKIEQDRYKRLSLFVKAKAKRLLIPYIFVSLLWVIPIAEFFYHYESGEIILRYILATSPNQLWFLWMLFWVYIFGWFFSGTFDRKPYLGGVIISFFYVLGMAGSRITLNYYCIWTGCQYLLFFWIGFMMRKLGNSVQKPKWYLWLVVYVLLFIIWEIIPKNSVASVIAIGVHISGAIAAFIVLNNLAMSIKWRDKKSFVQLSRYTMPIYLFHQQIVYFSIMLFNGGGGKSIFKCRPEFCDIS